MSDSGRKVDIVAAAIEEAISTGRWPVGSKLPPETALVEELGVARNTMREAVRALAHAGVLSVRHGGGVYVMAASPVEGLLGRRLARSDVLDVLSLRRGLEVEAARLAAQHRTPEDLARIHAAWNAHPGHVGGFTVEAGLALHLSIVEASHNSALIDVYRGVLAAVTDSLSTVSIGPGFPVDEHRALIAAIEEGNPDKAARAAGAALDTVIDTIERSLS
ncbi:FadR family transcriptional regulator [Rhodococcus sp. KBW08]|uniref:FadR/GntR family transcriptional regulator n=1 Tax=Rhodococcus sp. KBW08 TaxID=2144188 RepID=UPI000F5ABD1D|nr:FadR/GntR family transcriptional regulator [Rhodococcus sp. KBW08]RQO46945.1 FadR family transcriptional regulator [Rhodococcus sp. KBW08]